MPAVAEAVRYRPEQMVHEPAVPPREREIFPHQVGLGTTLYQPIRKYVLPDGEIVQVFPEVNGDMYRDVYEPVLVEGAIPDGFHFSFHPTAVSWMKKDRPGGLQRIKDNISAMEDPKHSVWAGPFNHVILPHVPWEDKDMLIKMGLMAFKEEFGFQPKGFWPPETMIDGETLWLLHQNGVEFVVLREDQLQRRDSFIMFKEFLDGSDIALVPFEAGLGVALSFHNKIDDPGALLSEISETGIRFPVTDMELNGGYGKPHRSSFPRTVLDKDTLQSKGMSAFSIKRALQEADRSHTTDVWDNSSWSCAHGGSRWRGESCCEHSPDEVVAEQKWMFSTFQEWNRDVNGTLDIHYPGWRQEFVDVTVSLRDQIFTGGDFFQTLGMMFKEEKQQLYAAKIYTIIGMTSCGWFFGGGQRGEREIPRGAIRALRQIFEPQQGLPMAA